MPPKTNPRVVPIQIFNVRAFPVQSSSGWVVIDAGMPACQGKLARSIRDPGLDPRSIQNILLTHDQLDPIGCLAYLIQVSKCRVVCHRSLAPPAGKRDPGRSPAPGSSLEALPRPGPQAVGKDPPPRLPGGGFRGRTRSGPLQPGWQDPAHPGPSARSSSLVLDCGMCWIGGLLREARPGQVDTGLFYQNRAQILSSLEKIAAARPRTIYPSHGSTMTGSELDEFLRRSSPVK